MNPVSTLESSLLWVSSKDKTSGTHGGDFTVNIPNSVNVKGVVKVAPQLITFPHLFPNVSGQVSYLQPVVDQSADPNATQYPPVTLLDAVTFTVTSPQNQLIDQFTFPANTTTTYKDLIELLNVFGSYLTTYQFDEQTGVLSVQAPQVGQHVVDIYTPNNTPIEHPLPMTSNVSQGYVASSSSVFVTSDPNVEDLYAYKAFDNNDLVGFACADGSYNPNNNGAHLNTNHVTTLTDGTSYQGEWLQLQMPTSIIPSSYKLQPRPNDVTNYGGIRSPLEFVLVGSNNGSDWELVDSQNLGTWGSSVTRSFNVTSTMPFSYYRLVVQRLDTSSYSSFFYVTKFSITGIEQSVTAAQVKIDLQLPWTFDQQPDTSTRVDIAQNFTWFQPQTLQTVNLTQQLSIPSNWYTADTLTATWNALVPVVNGFVPTLSVENGKFVLTAAFDLTISLSESMRKVLGIIPSSITFNLSEGRGSYVGDYFPNLSGPQQVFVLSSELGTGNMVKSSDGKTENCLAVVPLAGASFGSIVKYAPDDIWLHDVDLRRATHLSKIGIRLVDDNMNTLELPFNFDLNMVLKLYHVDITKF